MGSRQSTRSVAVRERLTAATAIGLGVIRGAFMSVSSPVDFVSRKR